MCSACTGPFCISPTRTVRPVFYSGNLQKYQHHRFCNDIPAQTIILTPNCKSKNENTGSPSHIFPIHHWQAYAERVPNFPVIAHQQAAVFSSFPVWPELCHGVGVHRRPWNSISRLTGKPIHAKFWGKVAIHHIPRTFFFCLFFKHLNLDF